MMYAVTAFARPSSPRGLLLMPLLRVIALSVVVAVMMQSGQCPLDACDEDLAGQAGAVHYAAAESGACHNCICIGTAFVRPTRVLPDEAVTFAAFLPPNVVSEAHAGQPFLPPRSQAWPS